MATVSDLIRRSLTKLGVLADGETPTASQEADAFEDLNDMLDEWAAEGLDVSTFVTVNDSVDLPPGYSKAIRYNLALEVAPDYGVSPSPDIIQGAAEAKYKVKRTEFEPRYLESDPALLSGGVTDITTLE